MKRTTKQMIAFLLCLAVLPVDGMAALAKERASEPPAYMRELSRLVAATASEDDFGEIRLTVGEPEMEVDGETQLIESAPFIDDDGEIQIPPEIFDDVPDDVGAVSPAELEAYGYEVCADAKSGTVTVTEPYGLCRLIVRTTNGKVKNTYGAVQTLAVSDNRTVLQYADKQKTADAAAQLRADPSVVSCVRDRIVSVHGQETDSAPNNLVIRASSPRCWGTQRAGADAWVEEHTDDHLAQIVVAVIDTGVDATHPFLEGRILSGGWDFVNDDDDPTDDHYHGTHCAGIIRDATPDNVKILPVKVLSFEGKGDNAVCREAMRWAADQGADIFSMSFGSYPDEEELEDEAEIREWLDEETAAIRYAYDAGVTCVAAAGNESDDLDVTPHAPAGLPHVITVGSIDEEDMPSSFTNHGSMVDVCAPGENIVSSVPNGNYQALSGTSMACPLVAAVCANYLSTDKTRTPDDMLRYLTAHAEDVGTPGWDAYCGAGCVSMREYTPVTGLTLPYETLRVPVATTVRLHPVFSPANATTRTAAFTSSDPAVATVDAFGNVFTKKGGDAVITVAATEGGFTACCMLHVLGGSGVRAVSAINDDLFVLRTDGTVQYSGMPQTQLGSTSFFFYNWGTVRDKDRMPISGMTQFWTLPHINYRGGSILDTYLFSRSFFTKEDGNLYEIASDGSIVRQRKANGQLLTGITDIQLSNQSADQDVFALHDSGTVFVLCGSVWQPVLKEDGSVLQNVRRIGRYASICEDGSVWVMIPPDDQSTYCTLAVPYTPVCDAVDGFVLVDKSSGSAVTTAVFVLADGTVRGVGDNTFHFLGTPEQTCVDVPTPIVLEDGQPLTDVCALHFTGYSLYALRTDGSVYAWGATNTQCSQSEDFLGVGTPDTERSYPKPVVTEDGSPLTGVLELLTAYGGRMLFMREDNSVWICGFEQYQQDGLFAKRITHDFAVPYRIADETVYVLDLPMEPAETVVPVQRVSLNAEQLFLGVGSSMRLEASVLPTNADNPSVVFRTGDSSIASVSAAGVVTGIREGTTTIRANASEAEDDVYAVCTVTVFAKISSVTVSKLPDKTVYDRGEPFDATGGELCIRLENGSFEFVPLGTQFCSGYDTQQSGWQRITVDYAGFAASFSIFVRQQIPLGVTLIHPDKTNYLIGQRLDLTGGALTVRFSDGTQRIVPLTEEMCSPFDNTKDSVQEITVQYLGMTASFRVYVHAPQICGIAIYDLPEKQNYAGETQIDPTGGKVVYMYEDGSQGDVVPLTAQMCDNAALSRLGRQAVTVTLDGFKTTFSVYVHTVDGATLSMHTLPECLNYTFTGSTVIDPRAGSVLLQYPDGAQDIVAITAEMCSLPESHLPTSASWEITVTYLELTTSFTVYNYRNALDFAVDHIEMARLPDQTTYRRYRAFSPAGGVVRLCGADGRTLDVVLSQTMLNANTFTVGDITAAVRLEGCTVTFPFRVLNNMEVELVKLPDRTVFCLGETFKIDGLQYRVTQYTNDPDQPEISYDGALPLTSNCSGFDMHRLGEQTVTVNTVVGIPLRYTIHVIDMTLESDAPLLQCGQSTRVRPVFRLPTDTPKIKWSSSDTSVATVDKQGKVTAVGVGTAEIIAAVNRYCTASCTITVQQEAVEPESLVFLQAPDELTKNDTVQYLVSLRPLNAAVRPILWSSSDPSILSVDATGTATAVRAGTATLTARIEGSTAAVTCTVTVLPRTAERLPGDADGDGVVTLQDAAQILRYLTGGWGAVIDQESADVNGGGNVDLKDVVLLRRYLAGGWDIVLDNP